MSVLDLQNKQVEEMEDDVFISESDDNTDDLGIVKRKLDMDSADRTIKDVVTEINEQKIRIDPDFQRNYVWNQNQASKLIESLLLNIPIPNIYLSETQDSKWDVIDGVQRLTTLKGFYANEYSLKGLLILNQLNGKFYSDLDEAVQRFLDDKLIRYIRIKKTSDSEIKFDVFMRLNQGSVKLNEQELRNCLYRGEMNDFLKTTEANYDVYKNLLNVKEGHNVKVRMRSVELLLRFLSVDRILKVSDKYEIDITNYNGRIKTCLNSFMELANSSDNIQEKIKISENKIVKACENLAIIFKDSDIIPFRLKGDNKINIALAEVQLISMLYVHNVERDIEKIKSAYSELLENSTFTDTVRLSTGNTSSMKTKYTLVFQKFLEKGVSVNG